MVTGISGPALGHSVLAQPNMPVAVQASRPTSQSDAVRGASVLDLPGGKESASTSQVAVAFAQIRGQQEVLNKAASLVREVVVTAEKAEQLLSAMEEDLGAVVKMYPPYPIDNPERISLLNSFGGLRRQIDALTFPPPESLDALGKLFGVEKDPKTVEGGESGNTAAASLIKEPMWDILTLDAESASNDEVSAAMDQVKAMKTVVERLQAGMWKDVVSYARQEQSAEVGEGTLVRAQLADAGIDRDGIGRQGISRNAHQLEQAAESR